MIAALVISHLIALSLPITYFYFKNKKHREVVENNERDIQQSLTDNKKLIQVTQDRIWATLESMAEGVLITDDKGQIILINTALSKNLSSVKKDLQNIYYWEVIRDQEINEMIKAVIDDKKTQKTEHTLLLSEVVFEIQASPVWSGSDFLGVIVVFHDVTRLKELEKIRTDFVANVSHELKTPLTSILGYVETLKEGAIDDKKNRDGFLDIIDNHARKLHALIEELLLLSSVESHDVPIQAESIDLDKMIDRILPVFHVRLAQKNVSIDKKFSESPFMITVDPGLFERALTNLIDNAVKYSHLGGKIVVEALIVEQKPQISVIDKGQGIAEADLARVFERFYRADKSRARDSGGTGLGLAIVKHIIERHQGHIRAESRLDHGSTFTITLP